MINEFVLLQEQNFTLLSHIVETILTGLLYRTWTSKKKEQDNEQQIDTVREI